MLHLLRRLSRLPRRAHILLASLTVFCLALLALACSLGEPLETRQHMAPASMAHSEGLAYFMLHHWRTLSVEGGRLVIETEPELLEDGKPLYPTLGFASRIAGQGQGRYRFQDGGLVFSATDNLDPRSNGRYYELRRQRTPVEASPQWYALALVGLAGVLGAISLGPPRQLWANAKAAGTAGAVFVLLFPPILGLALALAYAVTIAVGIYSGFAQPLAAPYLLFPGFSGVARVEPYLPHFVLAWTGLGALLGWLGMLHSGALARASQCALARLLRRAGLPLLLGICLFSVGSTWGAAWLGIARSADAHYVTLGGMLPINDGPYYFFDPQVQRETGQWHIFPVRRPVGCALRSAQALVVGYSLPGYQAVQAGLIALAAFLAALAVGRWRGTWAGVGFIGLLLVVARNFLPATSSEPAGLAWSCLGLCLLVDSIQRDDTRTHAGAVFLFTVALMARPGPMLVLPALLAWSWWRFRPLGRRQWKPLCAAVLALVLGLGFQQLLASLYGEPKYIGTTSIWYFLSQDMDQRQAFKKLNAEFGTDYSSPHWADQLHAAGMAELKRNPGVLLRRLREGLGFAPKALPLALLDGYSSVRFPRAFALGLSPLLLLGLALALRRPGAGEIPLWLLLLPAIAASAIAVYQYDGSRTFMAVYPFLWLLGATGFSAPTRLMTAQPNTGMRLRAGFERSLCLATMAVLLGASITAPALAHRLWTAPPAAATEAETQQAPEDLQRGLLKGGPGLCGILLVPDGEPVPKDVPAMPHKTFLGIAAHSSSFFQAEFPAQPPPPGPVSLVIAHMPWRDMPERYNYIFAPPEVLQQRDVRYWSAILERRTQHSEASLATWAAWRITPLNP